MNYSRHISADFVGALNDLYASGDDGRWWRNFLSDREIFVAIRNDALHVYYRGCRLAEITLKDGAVSTKTHYKYLLRPELAAPYVSGAAGALSFPPKWSQSLGTIFIDHLSEKNALKKAANPYGGDEKKFVGEIIAGHENVFDVEIALTRKDEETQDPSALRLDLAALSLDNGSLELVMYEAKLFSNPELRASDGDKNVIGQIRRYEKLLTEHKSQIKDACFKSAENVLALEGMSEARKAWAKEILGAGSSFAIHCEPILIIGGFDADQKRGAVWAPHRKKLEEALGKHRVIEAGSGGSVKLRRGRKVDKAI